MNSSAGLFGQICSPEGGVSDKKCRETCLPACLPVSEDCSERKLRYYILYVEGGTRTEMNKARPRTPFTRVDKGTHQHNPNMHGKSFSVPATSRQDLAKRSGQHARDCEYWITSVVRGRPLKDLFNYFLLLDITFLRNYWTVLNENDYFPRLDTMDKLKKTGTDTGSEQHE
ncbi:hypothetical protein QQF64_009348, partial [Cirrhinus molitorella]